MSSLLQGVQDDAQAHVALFKIGHGGHDLLVGGVVSGDLKLLGKLGQLVGVGGVVADHVLHQRHQLLHGGVLALAGAGAAVRMAVLVLMVVMVVLMAVVMVVVMLVIVMHRIVLLGGFFYIIISICVYVKTFIFESEPPGAVA